MRTPWKVERALFARVKRASDRSQLAGDRGSTPVRSRGRSVALGLLFAGVAVLAQQGTSPGDDIFSDGTSAATAVATSDPASVPDQAPVSLSGDLPAHDQTVGTLVGKADVSGGAAVYSIPIVVPPGRRGMQPEIALDYNSRAGNGLAGMGWSLSGGSAINRCPSTLDQDGLVGPVDLTANDKLCLDGQRLVLASGVYGQAGATYATEIQSFARITQMAGGLSSTSVYFKVEEKSGEIRYYGGTSTATSAARVFAGGTSVPMSWLIERQEDPAGNSLHFLYNSLGNGETLLSSVRYTGFGSNDGDRHVDFSYETRPAAVNADDQTSSYFAGGLVRQTQRLKTITTAVGTAPVREYRLAYQLSSASWRSLLSSVTECAYSGGTPYCRPATRFTWQQQAPTYGFHPLDLQGAGAIAPGRITAMKPAGDFNGDGTTDYLVTQRNATNSSIIDTYLLSLTSDRKVKSAIALPVDINADYQRNVDFDLDGRADVLTKDANENLVIRFWHGPIDATDADAAFDDAWPTGISDPLTGTNAAELAYTGDMDGDGRADILVKRQNDAGPMSCKYKLEMYRNTPSASGGTAPSSFVLATSYCLAQTGFNGSYPTYESLHSVSDFDGDGLVDLFIWSMPPNAQLTSNPDRIAYGQRAATFSFADRPYSQLFPQSDPIQAAEASGKTFSLWTDLNGDGLDDLVWAKAGSAGAWTVRFNTGAGLAPRTVFATNVGIERCGSNSDLYCTNSGYSPWNAQQITTADIDGDGRAEILIPRRFAQQSCTPIYRDSNRCPNQPLVGGRLFPKQTHLRASGAQGLTACQEVVYMCPEDPVTGTTGLGTTATFDNGDTDPVSGLHQNGYGSFDTSQYFMDALRLVETGSGNYALVQVPTSIISGDPLPAQDLYGDGLQDVMVSPGCGVKSSIGCAHPVETASGSPVSPSSYPGGYSFYTPALYINENQGASPSRNPDGITPQVSDMLAMVTNGMGAQTVWTYYPLGSSAGRDATELPLYTVPAGTGGRYVDDRHFYFTSSMPVVAEMAQSDGLGGFRNWRYGYSEAMYQARGRGFQGFHTITEEDEAEGVRTTTTFNQKFPLTNQPAQVVVTSLKRRWSDLSAPLSREVFSWRCNRANRLDASACTPPNGTARVVFPFLDLKETWNYDASVADSASGSPALLSYRAEVAADDATCTGGLSSSSSYDGYGNLTASTVLTYDGNGSAPGDGADGSREFVAVHCVRTRNAYATADTANWWLDRLSSRTVTTAIAYNPTIHPLPTGVANPAQTVITSFRWNPNRTTAGETVQPGVPNQERITAYAYPTPSYGLPSSVTVTASGDPNGARTATTSYTADGYFSATVSNAVGHQVNTVTRPEDGQPSQITDANGLRTLLQYDAFGFNTKVQYRGATDAEYVAPDKQNSLSWCSSCLGASRTRLATVQDGTPSHYVYADLLGRTVGEASRLADSTWSFVATQYDAVGRPIAQSEPYRSGTTAYWIRYAGYDLLGRPATKIAPQANQDGRGDRVTSYSYAGRTTRIVVCGTADADATRCLRMSRSADSLGRYVETVDANGGVTEFWYDGAGNALAIRDPNGNVLSASYNALGQRTAVNDPNQGRWQFAYDALGELLAQTDARGIVTATGYDKLGRPVRRSATFDYDGVGADDAVVDTWSYDPSYGKGKEAGSSRLLNGVAQWSETNDYDPLSRPRTRTVRQLRADNATTVSVAQGVAYDAYYGWPKARSFGNAELLWLRYSRYGDVVRESNGVDGSDYRVVNTVDARGNPTRETWSGGNITVSRAYLAQTGQVASIDYSSPSNPTLRSFDYAYDVFGNLGQQDLNNGATRESYRYDSLQRLTEATRTGGASGTVDYTYDALGNLDSKSDFSATATGAYSYDGGTCGGGPNAVKAVALAGGGRRSYCYDAAGNLVSDSAGLGIRYDQTQRPLRIARGGVVQTFDYAPDGERFREAGTEGEVQFFGGLERRYTPIANDKTYVGSNSLVTQTGSVRTVAYLLTDRLGSVDAIANSGGALIESRGFDAFGKPRTGTWADASPARLGSTAITPHGFTGHEHLNSLELIHMNGRVYDYNLGRFTGVDPFIQFPLNSQSLNPYSYILNNPLASTDPTGYLARDDCNRRQSCEMRIGKLQSLADDLAASFQHKPSSLSFPASNGAELGSSGQTAPSQGLQSFGGAPRELQFWHVRFDEKSNKWILGERVDHIDTSLAAVNGMENSLEQAVETMGTHVKNEYGALEFTLVYNPTHGFFRDLLESFANKLGVKTQVTEDLASELRFLKDGGAHVDWMAHSQGGVIFAEAVRRSGLGFDGRMSVAIDAGANNHWATSAILRSAGIVNRGYLDAPNDAVPNIAGLNGNPLRIIRSIISFPLLFTRHSQHTNPCLTCTRSL